MYSAPAAKRIANLLYICEWAHCILTNDLLKYSKTKTFFEQISWTLYPEHDQFDIHYTKPDEFASVISLLALQVYNDRQMKANLAYSYLLAPCSDGEFVRKLAELLNAERTLLYLKFADLVARRSAFIMDQARRMIHEIGEKEKIEKKVVDEYADNVPKIIEELSKKTCSVPDFALDILERFEDNLESK